MKIIIFLTVCLASSLGQRLSPPRNPPSEPPQGNLHILICAWVLEIFSLFQIRDVPVEIITEEDVARQRIHVGTERETVMDLQMEELMMDTQDVVEILFVEATTARSLVSTTTRRMIVAIFRKLS